MVPTAPVTTKRVTTKRVTTKAPALEGRAGHLAGRRLGVLAAAADRWAPLLLAGLGGLAVLVVLARYPIGQSGDGLIQTVFCLQKLTVFYWGADRFANVLPALAMPVTDPHANAVLQLLLRIAFGLAAPLLVCALVAPDAGTAWRATLASSALLLAFAPQATVHDALIEVTPYGTSFALAGFALLALRRAPRLRHGAARTVLRAVALALTCAAYLTNASLALVAAPLLAGEAVLFGSALAVEFGLASLFAGAVTWAAMRTFGMGAPTSSRFGETTVGLVYFGQRMLGKPGVFFLGMALAGAAALLVLRYWRRDPRAGRYLGHGAVLVATFAASFLAVALSSWVVLNYLNMRYLVPDYVLAAALGGLSLVTLIHGMAGGPAGRNVALLAACACLLLVAAKRKPPLGEAPHDIVAAASRPVADAVAAAVAERGLDGVAGDYWDVWPAVFQAEQLAHDAGRPPGQVFGVAYRGDARRDAFAARLIERGRLGIACVGLGPASCEALVVKTMAPPGMTARPAWAPATLPDGRALTFMTVERPYPARDGAPGPAAP